MQAGEIKEYKLLSFNMHVRTLFVHFRSEAIQRTGRAGRTAPGKCFRLFSK